MRKHNLVILLSLVDVVPSFEDEDNDWTMVEFNEVKMPSALRDSLAFQGLSLFRMKAYSVRVCVRLCPLHVVFASNSHIITSLSTASERINRLLVTQY